MTFTKSALAATVAVATALGVSATASSAHASKRDTRNFIYGAAATAVVLSAIKSEDCKKWKRRYQRTGNPYFLDCYYDCK